MHQPRVVGEMFAGIMLGPSLLGWVAPHFSAYLFPASSLGFLNGSTGWRGCLHVPRGLGH
jgi:Kef-type K+ transport system membrane component KefB